MIVNKKDSKYFTDRLMTWHRAENTRSLPWKEETNPYKIWLSEIILQQTRAAQGLSYYLKFTEAYPTIVDLANADDEAVFRLWQGLGYYNRCRNMLVTARYITNELGGVFPSTYDNILKLKGVGAYTAAAIASFAYSLPYAVVDGNVYRVLSRYLGIEIPIDSTEGKKMFASIAQDLLDVNDSAGYNQAIMDLGATVCTPKATQCEDCPLVKRCMAKKQNLVGMLPVKSKKLKVKKRFLHYILFMVDGRVWIRKRTAKDVWQNLYEPYLVEAESALDKKALIENSDLKIIRNSVEYQGYLRQRLTHQQLEIHFFECRNPSGIMLPKEGIWVQIEALGDYAFPKSIVSFFEKKLYI